jgi:uncharacterized protein YdeI (YjbR/CyaY-like superfamily)
VTESAPRFFEGREQLRRWLHANHDTTPELWLGFWKKATGRPSVTWPEVVDECLCVGWIDGIRKSIDADSFKQRITPRRRGSNWSAVNVKRMNELIAEGRVLPAGLTAFEARDPKRTNQYSNEQQTIVFAPEQEAQLRAHEAAWVHWQKLAASYRRAATWWVVSAKQEATRQRRLAEVIERCAQGLKVGVLTPPSRREPKAESAQAEG